MKKKEVDRTSFSRKAQITVFIIVGLLILFSFIVVIKLTSEIGEGKLKGAQEKMIAKVFKKEALRIFVEDCLTDELENGLILLGRQGRLWSDQPGGTKDFVPGRTGISLGGERVFYGISREEYVNLPEEAYPCDDLAEEDGQKSEEENRPEFCQYKYPDTKVGYGSLELKTSTLQNDLRRYLMNRTVWCVENFTRTNISSKAFIETGEIDLKLKIENDGIDVKVDYPLKLHLGGEEFFHLSKFDFFYPTKFKGLLDAAVASPLQMDWKFIDFNYTTEVINGSCPYEDTAGPCTYFTHGNEEPYTTGCALSGDENYYLCKLSLKHDLYSSLAVEMETDELEGSGDTIYEFKSPLVINRPETFVYRFVRQNRPPALDYVEQLACPELGYDYLVIKDDPEYGDIDITAFALDPDEDPVDYLFVEKDFSIVYPQIDQNHFYVPSDAFKLFGKGIKEFFIRVADEHGLEDSQTVRVLVDRPMEIKSELWMPYEIWRGDELLPYSEAMEERAVDSYLISNEDPVFLKITLPEESSEEQELSDTFEAALVYDSNTIPSEIIPPNTIGLSYSLKDRGVEQCFALPNNPEEGVEDCIEENSEKLFEKYKNFIEDWDPNVFYYPFFQQLTNQGELTISFSQKYCHVEGSEDSNELRNSKTLDVVVMGCIPHRDPEHPWAYPYHEYLYDEDGEYIRKEEGFNPFLATHSCCTRDFNVYAEEEGHVCFENPQPGCYGKIKEPYYTVLLPIDRDEEGYGGYVLEKEERLCGGDRGNICDGDPKYSLWEDEDGHEVLQCGYNSPDYPGCEGNILDECQGELAWGYVDTDDADEDGTESSGFIGWCHGTMGCTELCEPPNAVVFTGPLGDLSSSSDGTGINTFAKLKFDRIDYYQCGCGGINTPTRCDADFNGVFEEGELCC